MKVTTLLITALTSLAAIQAATVTTLPLTFPKNQYYVSSNLISAIEYLHRAFPSHPSVYTQDGNFVYNYVDSASGNVTDFVDPADLYLNAQSFNDVLIGIETVMYNQFPNPDTDPISLKIATNYITTIASYDFSTSDQDNIASFYNFTVTRYKNLFARENSTALIPLTPISLTNNTNKITTPTPLLFNNSIFDDIDGKTYNDTLTVDPNVLASNVVNTIANTLQLLGIPVNIVNGTNTTTTTTTTASITPTSSSTSYTSAEPSVTDTNDPGCDFTCDRRRRRRENLLRLRARATPDPNAITISAGPSGSGTTTPATSVSGVTSQITISQGNTPLVSGITGSDPHVSMRAKFSTAFKKVVAGSQAIGKVAKIVLVKGIGTALKEGFIEASKGTGIGASAVVGLVKAGGVVGAELVENFGDLAPTLVDKFLGGQEKDAMKAAMTSFFGFPENVANDAIEIALSRADYADSTTLAKTKLAIGIAVSKAPAGTYPDFETGGVEDWVGKSMDKIINKKYPGQNLNRNSKFVPSETVKAEDYPTAEFDALKTVLEGVTDKVATSVEFDEEKFLTGLGNDEPERTFGYEITASRGIDSAVSTIAALTTDNTVTNKDNAGFISDSVTASGGQDAFLSKVKSSVLGKKALKSLGRNAMRARTADSNNNLQMDKNAQSIYNSLGEKAFSGLTKNVRNGLKTTAQRQATTKALVKNNNRTIFRNFSPRR
ncbi:hypothetical protein HDU76_006027 [Blyttiomyces sp. JEL0837]|nr:hypothetical protein HDU76_006027 [Blyttiomyces sp. JEL0837]